MSLEFVIDGYNIIKHPLFDLPQGTQESRLGLVEFIRREGLCGSPKNQITVVFDGYPDIAHYHKPIGNVNIVFSRQESADDKIKKLVQKAENPKRIVVVSDDREIKFFVRSYGVRVLGVEEFIGAKKKLKNPKREDALKTELTYTQMYNINKELKKIWLGD